MTKVSGSYVCVSFLLAVAWTQPNATSAQERAPMDLPPAVALPAALDAVLRGYEVAWTNRDAVALADLFTPDGYVLRPGQRPAHGRDAILQAYENAGGPLSLKPYQYGVDGAVGFIIGGYSSAPGQPEVGKFVLALRRDESGTWLIAADIDNGN